MLQKQVHWVVFWTKEKCLNEALKFRTKSEFEKNSPAACSAARKNKWFNNICSHIENIYKPDGYWTKEMCYKEALKYKTRKEFQNKSKSTYNIALKNKWLDNICGHMVKLRNYYNYNICKDLAFKCKSRKEFSIKYSSAYRKARINKWLNEICIHMKT
jgi:hypothetical protein